MHCIERYILLLVSCVVSIPAAFAGDPPYPPSPVIAGMEITWWTHQSGAPGSDNFQLTWADDDHLYGAYGDGGGFGGTNSDGRVSLGVARVEGTGKQYTGYNVWGGKDAPSPATFDGKSWGMICVKGVLYMWVIPDRIPGQEKRNHYAYIQLARSKDYGRTWELQEDWRFTHAEKLTIPTILNFGKNYAGARDAYVYSYFICPAPDNPGSDSLFVQKPGILYLARALPDRMYEEKSAWEFFTGLDHAGKPQWGTLERKQPVFKDPNGVGWCLSAAYNPGLKRYLLSTEHDVSHLSVMGLFDAPEPWGPWTTVEYYDEFEYFGKRQIVQNVFFLSFPTKWFSPDGTEFTMSFTGGGRGRNNDSFNTVQGRFWLKK